MKQLILGLYLLILATALSFAQIVDVNFSGGGTKVFSGWTNVNSLNYMGYGSFPGNASWPAPITANLGATNASLNRIAGAPSGGGPFLASESIYFGSFAQVPNALGGTLRISNQGVFNPVRTIVFQIQIGEASGFDFFNPSGFPKLTIYGFTNLSASYTNLVNRYQSGTFPSPVTGKEEPVYVNTWAYQWNVTNGTMANGYGIDFSGVTHSQVYGLRVDSTSILQSTAVIPEPSTYALLALGAAGIAGYMARKKQRNK